MIAAFFKTTVSISLAAFAIGCGAGQISTAVTSEYTKPVVVGTIEVDDVKESSGLSASECQDVLWTHNDAGSGPLIYATDLTGKHLGTWRVTGAENVDWESISSAKDAGGKCSLIIADIGDNDEKRTELVIYRVTEPTANADTKPISSNAQPHQTAPAEALRYRYPDGRKNAETVLVHPQTGDIYVVTKKKSGPAGVYVIKPAFGSSETVVSEKVGEISVPSKPEGLLTGGSMSPDGRRVMLCDVKNGYELVLPDGVSEPDAIWSQKPVVIDLGDRKQGEGVSYGRDGLTVYATSEKKNAPIYMIKKR